MAYCILISFYAFLATPSGLQYGPIFAVVITCYSGLLEFAVSFLDPFEFPYVTFLIEGEAPTRKPSCSHASHRMQMFTHEVN